MKQAVWQESNQASPPVSGVLCSESEQHYSFQFAYAQRVEHVTEQGHDPGLGA